MSLDFRVTKIENYEELYGKYEVESWDNNGNKVMQSHWHPRTEQIVFGCMATGIGTLTEKNIGEWYGRYTIWCQVNGFTRDLDLLPYKDVVQHIGLTTNVFPEEARTKWYKRIIGERIYRNAHDANYDRQHNNDTYNGIKKEKVDHRTAVLKEVLKDIEPLVISDDPTPAYMVSAAHIEKLKELVNVN